MKLKRTQKQIAERFKGQLDYFKRPNYLRTMRFWTTITVVLLGAIWIFFYHNYGSEQFYNKGPLSRPHATLDCRECHDAPTKLMSVSFETFHIRKTSFDRACVRCHKGHSFHAPNTVHELECIICHKEHHGPAPLAPVENANCITCHGDAAIPQASAIKGATLPPKVFDYPQPGGISVFKLQRPAQGFTQVINSLATDHPEFRILSEKWRDTNSLQFNHARHFAADIPSVKGRKLACIDCHVPDASGNYFQKISFEKHCQTCHSLQFDGANKDLPLPHGNPEHIRAFLRSLPTQYAALAGKQGIINQREVEDFVKEQMIQLRKQVRTGEELEQQVFFNASRKAPVSEVAGIRSEATARFPGCAYCHEVTPQGGLVPKITRPMVMDRWLPGGSFSHTKHTAANCVLCHAATQSKVTADILLPSKAVCAECHQPKGAHQTKGGAPSECFTCHGYHFPQREDWVLRAGK